MINTKSSFRGRPSSAHAPQSAVTNRSSGRVAQRGKRPDASWSRADQRCAEEDVRSHADLDLRSARHAGEQELVIAIFRQAVEDYLKGSARKRGEATSFLVGSYAAHLAGLAGFSAEEVWREAQRRAEDVAGRRSPR